jgi:hypothetical protein
MAGNSGFGVGIDKQVESDQMGGRSARAFDAAFRLENALQQIIDKKISSRALRSGHQL